MNFRSFLLPSGVLRCVALLGLLALTGYTSRAAEIKLSVEVKDGDKVSDIYKLVAKASSDDGIDKVEFRVDDRPPFVDSSIPYEFEWDTLADKEGEHKVIITAFDSNGKTKRLTLTLVIDNDLGQGADALAKQAQEALAAKDSEAALKFSRRALKADPMNLSAHRALASLYASKSEWDKAIETLEKVTIPEDNAEAMTEMATYRLQRAFRPENAANFTTDIQAITDVRRKVGDILVKQTIAKNRPADGDVKPEGHIAIGDAMLAAGHFADAVKEYAKCGPVNEAPLPGVNRLGLAYALNNQLLEATRLTRSLIRDKKDDAATRAVLGLTLLRSFQFAEARALVQKDVAAHVPAALVVAAFADIALEKRRDAVAEAKEALSLVPNAAEAFYALAMCSTDALESDHALRRAMTLAPFQSGPYLRYATRIVLSRNLTRDRMDQALNITDFVLKYDPENVTAKLMQALLYMHPLQADNGVSARLPEAEPILGTLLQKDQTSADILTAGAVYTRFKDQPKKTNAFLDAVRKNDPAQYPELAAITKPLGLIYTLNVKYIYRMGVFLTPATLYPTKNEG